MEYHLWMLLLGMEYILLDGLCQIALAEPHVHQKNS